MSDAKTALDLAEHLPAQEEAALFSSGPEDVLVYQEAKRALSAIPVDAADQIAALRAELSVREAVIEEMTPIEALLTERRRAEKAERERDEALRVRAMLGETEGACHVKDVLGDIKKITDLEAENARLREAMSAVSVQHEQERYMFQQDQSSRANTYGICQCGICKTLRTL